MNGWGLRRLNIKKCLYNVQTYHQLGIFTLAAKNPLSVRNVSFLTFSLLSFWTFLECTKSNDIIYTSQTIDFKYLRHHCFELCARNCGLIWPLVISYNVRCQRRNTIIMQDIDYLPKERRHPMQWNQRPAGFSFFSTSVQRLFISQFLPSSAQA